MAEKRRLKTIDLAYIGISAAIITACSWVTIPLTVPITLQTLGVCLVAALFGAKRGTAAVGAFILLGLVGVPVFHGFTGGVGVLLGSTGGYIIGFIFTALIVGAVSDKTSAKPLPLALSMAAGVLACYVFGTVWFAVVYARSNEPASLLTILGWCVFPFIIPDCVKIAVSILLACRLKRFIK